MMSLTFQHWIRINGLPNIILLLISGKTNWEEFQTGTLPEPAIRFTGNSLILYTDNQNPAKAYWQSGGRKISSIQTYDWRSNKNLLGDKVGGYIEARIRRDATEDAQMVNTAFWFDSPGPDLKYYLQEGDIVNGVEGIRPAGQIYEIDMCEYLNTEIVLHGNVDSKVYGRDVLHNISLMIWISRISG